MLFNSFKKQNVFFPLSQINEEKEVFTTTMLKISRFALI